MFAYLEGILAEKQPTRVVIDCSGVGYELSIPLSTYENLPPSGNKVMLLVHYQFNDTDGARLFGFSNSQEKELFRQLLSVSKIGPRTAIAVLSSLSVNEFRRAVLEGNISLICTVPGLGKKSSERLVLELRDKFNPDGDSENIHPAGMESISEDSVAALLTLGFSQNEVRKNIMKLTRQKKYNSAEELIKDTIKEFHNKAK
jgi:holliday junction DNA helicase RuvA